MATSRYVDIYDCIRHVYDPEGVYPDHDPFGTFYDQTQTLISLLDQLLSDWIAPRPGDRGMLMESGASKYLYPTDGYFHPPWNPKERNSRQRTKISSQSKAKP